MYKRPTLFLVRLVAVALLLLTTVPFPHARAAGLGASASTIETLDSASTRQGEAQLAERSEQAGGWGLPKKSHWHVEPGNLLVRDARFNYELDENHRRKVRIHRETGERTEYTWDCRDRLRQVKCPDGTRVRFFYDAFGRRVRKDVHPPLPNEEELRKLADEELRPALEAEEERRRGELASLEDIPSDQTADDVRAANSNQSMEPGALQVRPPAKAGADQALLPAPEEEELVLAHKLKTYEVGFLWDGDELAAEVHSQEGERVHVHRPGTFVPLLQVEQGEVFHVITDHLGTPKELIDGESRVAWSAAHGAWNNIQEQWFDEVHPRGRCVCSPFRGLGQYYDSETQLSSTRYRYWEADTGRWLSADPLGIGGGNNLFGFDGIPTIDVDALGLACTHGNSNSSTKPNHVYVIVDTHTGKMMKVGISGQPINQNGTSPRANVQLSQLNGGTGAASSGRYKAVIIERDVTRSRRRHWSRG